MEPSTLRDCEPVVPDRIDELCKDNEALIVSTSSRRSGQGIKSNQNLQSVKPSRNHRTTRKTPLMDFDSLLISRRRRSSVTKRPRHFEVGPTGSIFPDSDRTHIDQNTGIRKKTNRKSVSKGKKGTAKKSLSKSCAPTRPICLKVKIGNRIVVPSIHDKLDAPEKTASDSSDVIRSIHDTNFEVSDIVNKSSSNHDRADILDQGCNLKANTENGFSYPGTSPDSEVINSVPDTEAFEKGLPDVQDKSITLSMPLSFGNVAGISSPQMKMKKGKKKDKHCLSGVCSTESKQTDKGTTDSAKELTALEPGPKACGEEPFPLDPLQCLRMVVPGTQFPTLKDAEINHSSDLVAVPDSLHSEAGSMLVPCNIGQIFSKSSKAKAGSNNRSENLDSRSKKNKAAGKRGNKSSSLGMIQGTEKDEALVHNGVEGQLMAGNQSSIPEAEGSGLMVDGSNNQFAPPKSAWVLCDECKKWRRISAALADQIEVTNCGWTCRENTDKDFADCSIPQEKSNSEINKELEISDEEDTRENIQNFEKKPSKVDQPPPWSHIRSNFFLHRSRKTQTIDEVMVCHCKPPSDGRMGCGAKCLNRMLNIECVRGTCPCGELCSNQKFQKRKYSKLKWFRCGKKGFGLRAQEDISAGNFIIEYVGEVLDVKNYEARQREYALKGHRHFYFMTLNGSEVIDACSKGNLGRFINHSCEPNCRTEKWMVNGEVCVGLFAIKDIKKGEEVTFDYNYVRVFGAAVKKCVCGSSNCRGYIGGDPKSSEVIIQDESDDEFSEPVRFCEDNDMGSDRNNISSDSSRDKENNISGEPSEIRLGEGKLVVDADQSGIHSGTIVEKSGVMADRVVHLEAEAVNSVCDGSPDSIGQLNVGEDSDDSLLGSSPAAAKIGSGVPFHTHTSVQLADKSEGRMNKAVSSMLKDTPTLKDSENTALSCKPELDMEESKTKLKGDTVGRVTDLQKSNSLARTHRAAPSIKNGKLKTKKSLNVHGNFDLDKSNAPPHKSRKFPDPTLSSHVEAVEEKLNQLLDSDGGISKRKDASRGYLKLLILTAASGNTGDGESIQSTRDLSMILDALLKTKSRSVLVDIINKNGLQMLHNIMKRYRKEFNRTPILRKLLKILEYLANKEILTSEHITGGPPRPGVESFKDSILTLTEHADKQVHQTARNFRDTWIRKFLRRNCHMETDEYHHHSTYSQRLSSSTSYDHHKIRGVKRPSESLHSCQKQPTPISTTVETATLDHSPASAPTSTTNTTRTRKRKSRWDTPADENVLYTTNVTCNNTAPSLENADIDDEDVPPGFSIPCNNRSKIVVSPLSGNNQERNTSLNCASSPGVILGESQCRFTSLVPVSYGVPSCVVEQFGIRKGETPRVWTMSPGLPFCPFPPLPPHSKNSAGQPTSAAGGKCSPLHGTAEKICSGTVEKSSGHYHSGQKRPFACNNVDYAETSEFVESDERGSRGGHSSGQKYFKQPKWSSNNSNNPKIPPWVRIRNGWGNA